MSITRKMLKGMGLTEEQADTIIEAHNETVTGLVADRDKYKADAEKLPDIQKKLDEWEKSGYKQKYEDKVKEYDQLVADNTAKATKAAKEKAVRAYFESKNIMGSNLDLAMRGCGEEMSALELDGETIKDTAALDALVAGTYKGLVSKANVKGANPATPPANDPPRVYSKAELRNMSAAEINKNWDSIKSSLNNQN